MITTSDIPQLVKISILTQVPILLIGSHGVGKSSSVRQAIKKRNYKEPQDELEKLFITNEPAILDDIVYNMLENIKRWLEKYNENPILYDWYTDIENALKSKEYTNDFAKINLSAYELLADILYPVVDKESGREVYKHIPLNNLFSKIIFIDEINRANRMVLRAMLEVILSKEIGTEKLHWLCTICAGNPNSEEYDTEILDTALLDRFCVLYVKRDSKFILMNTHPNLVPDIKTSDYSFQEYEAKRTDKSERAYSFVSRVLYLPEILGDDLYFYIPDFARLKSKFIEGILGEPHHETKYTLEYFLKHEPDLSHDNVQKTVVFCKIINLLPEDIKNKWFDAIINHWSARLLASESLYKRIKPYISKEQQKQLLNRLIDLQEDNKDNEKT